MFKPTHFRFDHSVQWPGAGPTTEIHADTVRNVEDQGDQYTFIHASGAAFKIDKAQVTAYGVWKDDNVPNMPCCDEYADGIPSDDEPYIDDAEETEDTCEDLDDATDEYDVPDEAPDTTPILDPVDAPSDGTTDVTPDEPIIQAPDAEPTTEPVTDPIADPIQETPVPADTQIDSPANDETAPTEINDAGTDIENPVNDPIKSDSSEDFPTETPASAFGLSSVKKKRKK